MLSKLYESTEVDRKTWLHVPSGTLWSTSSDTHQVVIKRDFYSDVYTILKSVLLKPLITQERVEFGKKETDKYKV